LTALARDFGFEVSLLDKGSQALLACLAKVPLLAGSQIPVFGLEALDGGEQIISLKEGAGSGAVA
jgi:hypothetical protein